MVIYIDVPDNEVIAEGGRNDWGSNIIVPHLHHFSSQSLWLLVAQNYLTPIFYDRCLDLPYSSQAIIAKKVRPAVYGKENFFGALHAENSMFIKIAQMLNNYLSKVVSPLYWGCGSDLHTLLSTAVIDGSNFKLCDRSEFKVGKHFIGQVILRPEEVGATDLVIVAVLDPRVAASICTEARTLFPESEIISMVDIMLQNEKESSSSQ